MVVKKFRDGRRRVVTFVTKRTDPQGEVHYAWSAGKPSDSCVIAFECKDLATAMEQAEKYSKLTITF